MKTPSPELVTTHEKVLEIGLYYDPSDFRESDIVLEIVSYQDLYACNNSEIGVCLRESVFISKLIPSPDTNYPSDISRRSPTQSSLRRIPQGRVLRIL